VTDPKILKGGERKTFYQLRPHLSQMRTTKHMPFTRKKAAFLKKNMSQQGSGRPNRTPLNPPLGISKSFYYNQNTTAGTRNDCICNEGKMRMFSHTCMMVPRFREAYLPCLYTTVKV